MPASNPCNLKRKITNDIPVTEWIKGNLSQLYTKFTAAGQFTSIQFSAAYIYYNQYIKFKRGLSLVFTEKQVSYQCDNQVGKS